MTHSKSPPSALLSWARWYERMCVGGKAVVINLTSHQLLDVYSYEESKLSHTS